MDYASLNIGMYVCIMIQLTIMGIMNLVQQRVKSQLLGLFSFLIIISAIKTVFWVTIQGTLFSLIFGGPHEFLLAPVLYAYLLSINEAGIKEWRVHIIYPALIYIIIHPLRLLIFGMDSSPYEAGPFYMPLTFLFVIIYFLKGIYLFRNQLRAKLRKYHQLKFYLFYISINAYLIIKYTLKSPLVFNNIYRNEIMRGINQEFIFPFYLFFGKYVFLLFCLAFIYYTITEIHWVKKYFVTISPYSSPKPVSLMEQPAVESFFSTSFNYTHKDLNVESFLKHHGIDRFTLKQFLKENGYKNFPEFINKQRVKDFKGKIKSNENLKFDLFSLAKESGFKSKASFYRVFKKLEGMTPAEYIKQFRSK